MMHTNPSSSNLDQNVALVRALRSLRVGDVEIVAKVTDTFNGDWSVQASYDYDGYLFILIQPSDRHAEQSPSYMVSGKTGQVELAAMWGDDCHTLGRFGDIYGLTAELTAHLLGFDGKAG